MMRKIVICKKVMSACAQGTHVRYNCAISMCYTHGFLLYSLQPEF